MKITLKNTILFLTGLLICSCAQMVMPTGGEKDIVAPVVDWKKSYPQNRTVNFSSNTIVMEFDEYFQLKNQNQIILSPAPLKAPTYRVKGKKLIISFNEPLQENTTYTLNLSGSVSDITENNIQDDLTYVFSTGSFIDSMEVSGQLINAYTGLAEKGVSVFLHPDDDSAFYKNKPVYLTKTNNNGNYILRNIKKGTYRIYALRDQNNNFIYDQPGEEIAFLTQPLTLDSAVKDIKLFLFKEYSEKQYIKKSNFSWPGKFTIAFNKALVSPGFKFIGLSAEMNKVVYYTNTNSTNDSLYIWYPVDLRMKEINMEVSDDSTILDTITFYLPELSKAEPRLDFKSNATASFDFTKDLQLKFNAPIADLNKDSIKVIEDTVQMIRVNVPDKGSANEMHYYFNTYSNSKENKNKSLHYIRADTARGIVNIHANWKEKTNYTVYIPTNTVVDVFSRNNQADTLNITSLKTESFGNINIQLKTDKESNYILQLVSGKDNVIRSVPFLYSDKISFNYLLPGTYSIRIIDDINKNGKWDTGNEKQKLQPERVFYYREPITVRANWEIDIQWNF